MSIDMEEYGDTDGIAVVDSSGCSWYPSIDEDTEVKVVLFSLSRWWILTRD